MTNRPFLQPVALAGAVAISASLIGFAALQQTSPPSQTRAVVLTAGDAEIFLPDLSTFTPTVAEGFPPVEEVLQGAEQWSLINSPGVVVNLDGNDTQTTIGSFVNNDFLESGGVEGGAGMGVPLPASGSEIDLMSFGGGYESEWANLIDANGGHTITDTLITPFGDYTIPLGTTAADAPAAAFQSRRLGERACRRPRLQAAELDEPAVLALRGARWQRGCGARVGGAEQGR